MKIAIIKNDFFSHSASWTSEWLHYCQDHNISHDLIDWRCFNAASNLNEYDIVLWHFSHYSYDEMLFSRPILYSLKSSGVIVFPDYSDSYHFDDKVSQSFLLKSCGIRTPRNDVLFSYKSLMEWADVIGKFPIVAKLRGGSGSHNVLLINSKNELIAYGKKMFSTGISASPRLAFKVVSNLKSVHSFSNFFKKLKRVPEFIFSLIKSNNLPRERKYVYLQEFIPNASYDIKVVVIGSKLSFFGRHVRKGDFRASGGADFFFDHSIMTKEVIDIGFLASKNTLSDCIGLDIVVDSNGLPYVIEVSYGFSHSAILDAKGYFDKNYQWHNKPLNAPVEVLINKINQLKTVGDDSKK